MLCRSGAAAWLAAAISACAAADPPPLAGGDETNAPTSGGVSAKDGPSGVDAAAPAASSPAAALPPSLGQPPGPGKATVRVVTPAGTPAIGVAIVWSDMTGALVETMVTDGTGVVERTVDSPQMMVTALLKYPVGTAYVEDTLTWVGVKAGDALFVREEGSFPGEVSAATLEVPTKPAGATQVSAYATSRNAVLDGAEATTCSFSSLGATLIGDLYPRCLRDGKITILAQAVGPGPSGTTELLGFTVARDIVPTADGRVIGFGAWRSPVTIDAVITNVPSNVLAAEFRAHGLLGANGYRSAPGTSVVPAAGEARFTVNDAPPPDLFDSIQEDARFELDAIGGVSSLTLSRRGKRLSTSYVVDASPMLPAITSAVLEPDGDRPTVRWTTSAPLDGVDGITVELGDANTKRWRFIAPPGTTSVRVPALPPDWSRWAPRPTLSPRKSPIVTAYESDLLAGYDDFKTRQNLFTSFRSLGLGSIWAPWGLPADGTVRRTSFEVKK